MDAVVQVGAILQIKTERRGEQDARVGNHGADYVARFSSAAVAARWPFSFNVEMCAQTNVQLGIKTVPL
jgi:hypothetical protein